MCKDGAFVLVGIKFLGLRTNEIQMWTSGCFDRGAVEIEGERMPPLVMSWRYG